MYYSYPQKTELVVVPLQTGRSVREKVGTLDDFFRALINFFVVYVCKSNLWLNYALLLLPLDSLSLSGNSLASKIREILPAAARCVPPGGRTSAAPPKGV